MKLSLAATALLTSAIAYVEGANKMVIGYFPNWLYANYPVENIPFTKYTHINYAFAILNNEDNLPSFTDDWAVESSLPKVVQLAHDNKTKVLLSVGGWTGSKRFSPMVATVESRKRFIDWNLDFIEKYKTDGVDLDWEYPGKQAAGCNEFADNDADNFLALLKELRAALDAKYPNDKKEISMAVHVQPFVKNGEPMRDLKEFVPYFDHVNLMTYDINGAWASMTGPNAPFQTEEGLGAPFSYVDSIRDWKAAGVPAEKITAGLAFYGRSMTAKTDAMSSQFHDSVVGQAPKGDSDDAYWTDPYCNKEPGGLSGIWKWTNLRAEGVLVDHVTPGPGWQRNWDPVTQTPWLFNKDTKQFVTYDDPQSLKIKVDHALCEDLAGVMVWDIHQDNGELLEVVNQIHQEKPASCGLVQPAAVVQQVPVVAVEEPVAAEEPVVIEGPIAVEEPIVSSTEPEILPIKAPEEIWSAPAESDDPSWVDPEIVIDEPNASDIVASPELDLPTGEVANVYQPSEVIDPPVSTPIPSTGSDLSSLIGAACSISGESKCVNAGISEKWLTCNINTYIARSCAAGLVCHESGSSLGIYCDFPADAFLHNEAVQVQNKEQIVSLAVENPQLEAQII